MQYGSSSVVPAPRVRLVGRTAPLLVFRDAAVAMSFALVVLAGTGAYLSKYWVNFPFIDDYQTVVDFLNHTQTDSLARLVGYTLWRPHNEHRIVFTRLFATAYAYLSPDGVRFDVLSASGLVFRGLILWCLYREWPRPSADAAVVRHWSIAGFLVVVLVITSGRDMENVLWATNALQNIPVVVWALLSFGAASRNHWKTAWLLGALAVLTSGNGIFVLLILSGERLLNRRWIVGGLATILTGTTYILYRYGINLPVESVEWSALVPKFFAFQGSFFYLHYYLREYGVAYTSPTVLAGLLYTTVGLETLWRYQKKEISLFYPAVFAFVWLTAIPVAMFRPGVLEGRFAIYSMVLTGVVYAQLTQYLPLYRPNRIRMMHSLGLVAALLLFIQSFLVHDRTAQRQYRTSLAEYYTFWHNESAIYHQPRQKLQRLQQAGLFSIAPADHLAKDVFRQADLKSTQPAAFGTYKSHQFVRTTAECSFLLLNDGKNQVALLTDSHEDVPRYTTFFSPSWFPKGTYSVSVVTSKGVWPTHLSIRTTTERAQASRDECW